MFERFTDRARKVMALAREEAEKFNHHYIGSEHLLLGIMREGSGLGANVLRNYGIDEPTLRGAVATITQKGPTMVSHGQLPFTPRTKRVLELASEAARDLRHNYIGTEHLLLGIVRESDCAAVSVLAELDVAVGSIDAEVLEILGAGNEPAGLHSEAALLFDRYQEFTGTVAIYPGAGNGSFDAMTYCALKMNGEAGEFAEKLGKRIRKGKSITAINRSEMADEFKLELAKELGDVLWYVSQAASELGYSLSDVARINVEKLTSRKERGVLDGKGDNR